MLKILVVCESGGHLTQATYLMKQLSQKGNLDIILVTEDTNRTRAFGETIFKKVYLLDTSKYRNKYLRYLHAFVPSVFIKITKILKEEHPDVILSTAGWPSIPTFILAKLVFGIPTVYIHSWSRVMKKSDSGKFLYYLSDVFIVQWPQLLEKYGKKARYFGGII